MDRLACIDLPFFPLQLLLRKHPDWRDLPVAVVDVDRPQGTILWVNDRARRDRVLPGMRYAAALTLSRELRASPVPPPEIAAEVSALCDRLRGFTPHVEPAEDEPGVFWLDAGGLERLYGSLPAWAGQVHAGLRDGGFLAAVVVGFSRFGTYALARAGRGVQVVDAAGDERRAARRVPLDRLAFDPAARDTLRKLGVTTVGRFVDLPPGGIGKRFGPELLRLHRLATGDLEVPLQPDHPRPPAVERHALDHPETDVPRLIVGIEQLLEPLLATLAGRGAALAELDIGFRFERTGDHLETLRPATPTLDVRQVLELVRLRLQALRKLPDGVEEIVLVGRESEATKRQLRLFELDERRDLDAAGRALARVRARLGDAAVARAKLRPGHLPEGRYTWEPLATLGPARPSGAGAPRLVRRIHARPVPLPPRPRHEPDGWMLHGLKQGPVLRVLGPYVVAGGWWNRPVHREYHFAETRHGELLWVFYDRPRRRWYLQGRVE